MNVDPLASNNLPIRAQLDAAGVEELDETQAAEQFTTVLMSMVVKEMFKSTSVDGNDMFGNGPGSDVYRGFAQQAFAEALTKHGMDDLVEKVRAAITTKSTEDPE